MITGLPSAEDYEKIAKDCLTQSFKILFAIYKGLKDAQKVYNERPVTILGIHHKMEYKEVSKGEYFMYNEGNLRTSLILLHQSIECFLKSEICKTSPLLLIDKKREDWPATAKRFDSFYTISGEALLKTFLSTNQSVQVDTQLMQLIEKVRVKRNECIHGSGGVLIHQVFLLESILDTYKYFLKDFIWFYAFSISDMHDPIYGSYTMAKTTFISTDFLEFAEYILGQTRLSKQLALDITTRRYFCPGCFEEIRKEGGEVNSKWAVLFPNKPKVRTVKCVVCDAAFIVSRKQCKRKPCKGNVIYNNGYGVSVCLTCGVSQVDKTPRAPVRTS